MKVLVIGSGGREHALAWGLNRSPSVSEVVVSPGNAGMEPATRVVPGSLLIPDVLRLAADERPDLTVIGPEAPLVAGLADELRGNGFAVFGPNAAAAQLEGSKRYAKQFMVRHGIPTAAYQAFSEPEAALSYLESTALPVVVKDSALAVGKGVTIAHNHEQARAAVADIFSSAPAEVVVETFLEGQELSLLVLTDGSDYRTLPPVQDYKQAFDGDRGPMTGGMGTVASAQLLDAEVLRNLVTSVVEPTLAGIRSDGLDFRGVLFIGLMLTSQGPKVLEYNVRFGDPETQTLVPLLDCDLGSLLAAVAQRRLGEFDLAWDVGASACVVMAAPGYPGRYSTGIPIDIPGDLGPEVTVFHAGTASVGGRLVSAGGRVLGVTAQASDIDAAVVRAYRAVAQISFPGAHYRTDIGGRLLQG